MSILGEVQRKKHLKKQNSFKNMQNSHLHSRLSSIQKQLIAHHEGGSPSSTSKGREREDFINSYLEKIMPPVFRFGSGEAIDANNKVTGQLDLVVEYPLFPSLPQPGGKPRLYVAESIAAVIEVKSDLSTQWEEVLSTAKAVKDLYRGWGGNILIGDERFAKTIPVFAVGYKGWAKEETVRSKLIDSGVDAILVIDPGIFVANELFSLKKSFQGPWALWGFFTCLYLAFDSIKVLQADLENYA